MHVPANCRMLERSLGVMVAVQVWVEVWVVAVLGHTLRQCFWPVWATAVLQLFCAGRARPHPFLSRSVSVAMKRDRDDDEMEEWEEWIATDDGGFVRAERCADNRCFFHYQQCDP